MVQQSKNFLFGRKTTILCNLTVTITVQETGLEVWDKVGSNPTQPIQTLRFDFKITGCSAAEARLFGGQ
jgi:hypothetical protein